MGKQTITIDVPKGKRAVWDEEKQQIIFKNNNRFDDIKSFEDACKDTRTDLYKYPGDFTLYCVATWDDDLGQFENIIPARFIAKNVRAFEANPTSVELDKIEKEIEEK